MDAVGSTVQGTLIERQTTFSYNDAGRTITTRGDQVFSGDGVLTATIIYDGLGRTIETMKQAPEGLIRNTQTYDGMGRAKRSSNPFRSTFEDTYGYTEPTYDALSRIKRIESFDKNGVSTGAVTTDYAGNQTTVTDQAGKMRRSFIDGLGRLVTVVEDPNGLNLQTTYGYDVLDGLTLVTQGGQSRSFVYDSLKRLTQATNPESGMVSYQYDANGNLTLKTDSRNIITNYSYDDLNRVMSRSYQNDPSGTAAVSYTYDAVGVAFSKGRLTAVTSAVSSYSYSSFDAMGRVLGGAQTTAGQTYSMSYGYDRAGNLVTETYPSGRTITMSYDTAGRMSGTSGQKTGEPNRTYESSLSYTAHGAVASMQLGNGKWEHTTFNSRLQPLQIGLGTNAADSSILKLDYGYGTTNNNGNVLSQTITVGATVMSQSYGYDSLNRLQSATESGAWTQTYDYDRCGNRAVRAGSYIPQAQLTPQSASAGDMSAFNAANNRIQLAGFGYDPAGNLTSDPTTGPNAVLYDAENKQTSYTKAGMTTQYSYDGDGHRVKKVDGTGTTLFVYNAGGQLIAEYVTGTPPGSGTSYLTTDHLGSTRVVSKQDGTVTGRHDYLPFGEELQAGVGGRTSAQGYVADNVRQKFTQKERDAESGLDYFLARYCSSAQGRFTSVDPYNVILERQMADDHKTAQREFVAYLSSPQQWNRFAYAINNPLKHIDPCGERIEIFGNEEERKRAFERIKTVVGVAGAKLLEVVEENGHYYVEVKNHDYYALAVTGTLGASIGVLILNPKTLEFHIARQFTSKAGTRNVSYFGGGATIGADESLTGNAQIFVHPDAGEISNDVLFNNLIGASRSSEGTKGDPPGLFFYNDTVDAHEFGHAFANVIFNIPLHGSRAEESYPFAFAFENAIRERRGDKARRIKE